MHLQYADVTSIIVVVIAGQRPGLTLQPVQINPQQQQQLAQLHFQVRARSLLVKANAKAKQIREQAKEIKEKNSEIKEYFRFAGLGLSKWELVQHSFLNSNERQNNVM